MLCTTSSHMCGRWYLPMFLFRDGFLTLMYRASFIVLRRFWSSLPNILKLSIVTLWPEMIEWSWIGEGILRCSLNLSAKFLADSPIYSSSHPPCCTCICIWPTLHHDGVFVLGGHKEHLPPYTGITCVTVYVRKSPQLCMAITSATVS